MTENVRQRLTITGEYNLQNHFNKEPLDLNIVVFIFILHHFFFFGHIHRFFGQVQRLMFVGMIFWSRSIIHVCQCEFHSVIF